MNLIIFDGTHTYSFDNLKSLSINEEKLIIDYIDEEGEKHSEMGDTPVYVGIRR